MGTCGITYNGYETILNFKPKSQKLFFNISDDVADPGIMTKGSIVSGIFCLTEMDG